MIITDNGGCKNHDGHESSGSFPDSIAAMYEFQNVEQRAHLSITW